MKNESSDWVSRWAGSYTFISCTHWASQYFHTLKKILGKSFTQTAFVHREGTVTFFLKKREIEDLGIYLAAKVEMEKSYANRMLSILKENTDILLKLIEKIKGETITKEVYLQFLGYFERHLAYHVFMKKTVEYLSENTLKDILDKFIDARIYSEPVYSKTEELFRKWAEKIAKETGYNKDMLTCLTDAELITYLENKILPEEKVLEVRYKKSVILWEKDRLVVLIGKDAEEYESLLEKVRENKNEVKGVSAFPGIKRGRCRIIIDHRSEKEFNKGDILITGMTRPEFIFFIENAAAVVTDVGGMLCHAAIISRELKKPCITGTGNATKIFKDGDLVEVNATKGIVRRITV